ncbi:MAG: T9SS type A sorting domain-containing protein, partial [Bacteroidetes bacterium]|nr:T9SS type A sorting domain-containing protein [Bacteroidota bacterium]
QYDAAISSLFIGQNYPNPAAGTTTIPLPSAARERSILLFDITGRLISSHQVAPAATNYQLSTSELRPGMYYYQVFDGAEFIGGRSMQVLR